ncbi:hypothetical protein B0H11DRAFT_1914534 [Mycena galericulata]|nr:hypothetical protein B0H11DRAFT_1914534 [Mycena galericulata]
MSAPTRPINKTTPISDCQGFENSVSQTEQVERSTPRPESTKVSRRRASAKYRERNADELREKARERMAKVRQRNSEDVSLADAARARAREDSKKYREKHADALAHRKRIMRMDAFEKKHGHHAWAERQKKIEDQRREAQELEEWRGYEEQYQRALRAQEKQAAETLQSLGSTRLL